MKKHILLLLAVGALVGLAGCKTHRTRDDSKIPWARPASWQNKMPGISY